MRILELTVNNVRGIRSLTLKPNERNVLIWGPNGAGKSGVVDAIDFLISGRISRLTGTGTGGISLEQHGPHISTDIEEAFVSAVVKLDADGEEVRISRSLRRPDTLDCPNEFRARLNEIETLAKRGHHVLTRREILRYIATVPSDRARQIQELLDLSDIEAIRRSLVAARNRLREERSTAETNVRAAQHAIAAQLQIAAYGQDRVLSAVNELRASLGAEALTEVTSANVQLDVRRPEAAPPGDASSRLALRDIGALSPLITADALREVANLDADLRQRASAIREDPEAVRSLQRVDLTERGLSLMGDDPACPLCDARWDTTALREHLQDKLRKAQDAKNALDAMRDVSRQIEGRIQRLQPLVANLVGVSRSLLPAATATLSSWEGALRAQARGLQTPVESYTDEQYPPATAGRLATPEDVADLLESVQERAAEMQVMAATPQQEAWDVLTRTAARLADLESAVGASMAALHASERGDALLEAFELARDEILHNLYDSIRDRFVEFYKALHDHEPDFNATIAPSGPGLEFRVDFLGHGEHPPNALHSEGHQDSMGVCLFLALSERLSGGRLGITILDDVVMSVDAGHRKQICQLLRSAFADQQFVITTHDRTWAMLLRSSSVVTNANVVPFSRWSLQTGPIVGTDPDMWDRIAESLAAGNVEDAATRLRRGGEQFFESLADALRAPIQYRSDGQWTFGDWVPAAVEAFRLHLRKAKNAANSWNRRDLIDSLTETGSVFEQTVARVRVEQWAVNPHVHYTNWADLTPQEFADVVDAYKDLFGAFICSDCEQPIALVEADGRPVAVKCPCAEFIWNLETRP